MTTALEKKYNMNTLKRTIKFVICTFYISVENLLNKSYLVNISFFDVNLKFYVNLIC